MRRTVGAFLIAGNWTARFAAGKQIAAESLEFVENDVWTAEECPLCGSGEPLFRRIQ